MRVAPRIDDDYVVLIQRISCSILINAGANETENVDRCFEDRRSRVVAAYEKDIFGHKADPDWIVSETYVKCLIWVRTADGRYWP